MADSQDLTDVMRKHLLGIEPTKRATVKKAESSMDSDEFNRRIHRVFGVRIQPPHTELTAALEKAGVLDAQLREKSDHPSVGITVALSKGSESLIHRPATNKWWFSVGGKAVAITSAEEMLGWVRRQGLDDEFEKYLESQSGESVQKLASTANVTAKVVNATDAQRQSVADLHASTIAKTVRDGIVYRTDQSTLIAKRNDETLYRRLGVPQVLFLVKAGQTGPQVTEIFQFVTGVQKALRWIEQRGVEPGEDMPPHLRAVYDRAAKSRRY